MINNQAREWITKDNTPDGEVDAEKLLRVLNEIIRAYNELEFEVQQLRNR